MAQKKTGATVTSAEIKPSVVVSNEILAAAPEADAGAESLLGAIESVAEAVPSEVVAEIVAEAVEAPAAAPVAEHKDIGQWEATYWRGRAIWRHRRTKQTTFKRADAWRNRNLK